MRVFLAFITMATWVALMNIATADTDGAPWTGVDPTAGQPCISCRFDEEARSVSASVSLFFTDRKLSPGEPADIYVQFRNSENKKAGFQIESTAGKFTSIYEDIEANGVRARSLAPRDNASWSEINGAAYSTNVVMWKLQWTPPENSDGYVYFWVAVNESNDDQSPVGDQIHFKTIKIYMPGESWLLPAL